jgi:hypothetical protein
MDGGEAGETRAALVAAERSLNSLLEGYGMTLRACASIMKAGFCLIQTQSTLIAKQLINIGVAWQISFIVYL